jgi:hypothetical protein
MLLTVPPAGAETVFGVGCANFTGEPWSCWHTRLDLACRGSKVAPTPAAEGVMCLQSTRFQITRRKSRMEGAAGRESDPLARG